jgi:hypothetical protein
MLYRVQTIVAKERIGSSSQFNSTPCPLLGCTPQEFKTYMESYFRDDMTWRNHGYIWEIDHIEEVSSFDLLNPEEFKKCAHFSNTRPLLVHEHRHRHNVCAPGLQPILPKARFQPKLIQKGGKSVWMVDLRSEGKGRFFSENVDTAVKKAKAAAEGAVFEPQPVLVPKVVKKRGQCVWMVDLRSQGMGRMFFKTQEEIPAKLHEVLGWPMPEKTAPTANLASAI